MYVRKNQVTLRVKSTLKYAIRSTITRSISGEVGVGEGMHSLKDSLIGQHKRGPK